MVVVEIATKLDKGKATAALLLTSEREEKESLRMTIVISNQFLLEILCQPLSRGYTIRAFDFGLPPYCL